MAGTGARAPMESKAPLVLPDAPDRPADKARMGATAVRAAMVVMAVASRSSFRRTGRSSRIWCGGSVRAGAAGAAGTAGEPVAAVEAVRGYSMRTTCLAATAPMGRRASTDRGAGSASRDRRVSGWWWRAICNIRVAGFAGPGYDTQHEGCISYRSPVRRDTRPRRPGLGHHGPPDARHGHGRRDPARLLRVLRRPVGSHDGGDDAAGPGPGRPQPWSPHRSRPRRCALRRVLPRCLDGRRCPPVRAVSPARHDHRRTRRDRGWSLRAHALQTALPPLLPRTHPLWI